MPFGRTFTSAPLRLLPVVQHYAWGKIGSDSVIAGLIENASPDKHYAELWFGDHPNGPATVDFGDSRVPLSELLQKEMLLGDDLHKRYSGQLPFLLKVLSIRTALSIQAHPDTERARALHGRDPQNYPDDRSKPEAAIALSKVELLYGFRERMAIVQMIEAAPEVHSFFSTEIDGAISDCSCEALYRALMLAPPERVTKCCRDLYERLSSAPSVSEEERWILRLASEYPHGDVGLLSFYFLNIESIQPGDALFIGPNEPHAYLVGDMVECMAASDNVVRAGLTPKFRDVATLLDMLDYMPARVKWIKPVSTAGTVRYPVPTPEFSLELIGEEGSEFETRGRGELVLCLRGEGRIQHAGHSTHAKAGDGFLIPSGLLRYQTRGGNFVRAYVPL